MQRPHDTDRILAVLGEAIKALRANSTPDHWSGNGYEDVLNDLCVEVANDLALLHGAVSAEAQRWDDSVDHEIEAGKAQVWPPPGPTPPEVLAARRAHLRVIRREEYENEVLAGEHRWDGPTNDDLHYPETD